MNPTTASIWRVIQEHAPYIEEADFRRFADRELIEYVTPTHEAEIKIAAWLAIKVAEHSKSTSPTTLNPGDRVALVNQTPQPISWRQRIIDRCRKLLGLPAVDRDPNGIYTVTSTSED